MNRPRLLITGASGFLGSHIVDLALEQAYPVRVIARPSSQLAYLESFGSNIEIHIGDFQDEDFLEQAMQDIDVVIHSAARVSDIGQYSQFYVDNVSMTEKLLLCAKRQAVSRFVFVSSPSVVAELKDQFNIDETYPYPRKALNEYCETKAIAEQRVLRANTCQFTTCALRPRGIWGPRDFSGPFAKFLKKMHQGKLKNVAGKKSVFSSMCHAKNAASACLLATTASHIGGKAYFITDETPIEVWPFADQLAAQFQIPGVKGHLPQPVLKALIPTIETIWQIPYLKRRYSPPASRYAVGLVQYSATYNIDRAKQDLGYFPTISTNQGLEDFHQWVSDMGGLDTYLMQVK